MQLRTTLSALVAVLVSTIILTPASAQDSEVAVKTTVYQQFDNGGIEEIDEDVSVFEALILVKKEIDDKNSANLRLLIDVVSAASIERNHNADYRALQSGASGSVYGNLSGGWTHSYDAVDLTATAGFGREYAYQSFNLGLNASTSFNENNTTLGFSLMTYFDTLDMIRFNGTEGPEEDRDSVNASINLTQLLSPRSLINLDLSHINQDGQLATQFNSVWINGVEDYEILPDARSRTAFTVRYKHAVGIRDAIEVGFRHYSDDWGIDAETVDTHYFKYVKQDSILLDMSYRLYSQGEADYYQPRFTEAHQYQTSDPDLGDFVGHMFGLNAVYLDSTFLGITGNWDTGVFFQTRDNGLDSFWLTAGFNHPF